MQLNPDSEHIKSGFHHRLMRNLRSGAHRGWRPLRLGETIPPNERTLKILTKEEAERKKRGDKKQEA